MSSSQSVSGLRSRLTSPRVFARALSLWPPYLGAGVRVLHISEDWRQATVRLRGSRLTANYVGTQFGGSLFAMADPFWMLLIMHNLGRGYVVWDAAGEIAFLKPAKGPVTARFDLAEDTLEELRQAAAGGAKVLRWFETELTAADGTVVARVRKQVYVRKRR